MTKVVFFPSPSLSLAKINHPDKNGFFFSCAPKKCLNYCRHFMSSGEGSEIQKKRKHLLLRILIYCCKYCTVREYLHTTVFPTLPDPSLFPRCGAEERERKGRVEGSLFFPLPLGWPFLFSHPPCFSFSSYVPSSLPPPFSARRRGSVS